MVVLFLFATDFTNWAGFLIILGVGIAHFLPLRFVHPVRTKLWRGVTLPVCIAWIAFAGWAAWTHFEQPRLCTFGLTLCSAYLAFAGVAQQILGKAKAE